MVPGLFQAYASSETNPNGKSKSNVSKNYIRESMIFVQNMNEIIREFFIR